MSKYLFLPLCLLGGYMVLLSPTAQHIQTHVDIAHSAGQYSHGEPVRTHYLGIPPFDKGLSFFVTVFLQFTDGSNPDTALFALYFMLAGLMPNLVLWEIEASREKCAGGRFLKYPLAWNLLLQLIGACTVSPIYFLLSLSSSPSIPTLPTPRAAALLPALCIGYVLPTAAMFLPDISAHTRQLFIGLWQFFPLHFWICQTALSSLFKKLPGPDLPHLRRTYAGMFLLAFGMHVYTLWYIFTAADPAGRFKGMFVPSSGTPKGLAEGAVTFIQWDFVIGVVATVGWMGGCVWGVVREKEVGKMVGLVVGLVAGSVLVSPAAVVVAGFAWREERLREMCEKEGKGKKKE